MSESRTNDPRLRERYGITEKRFPSWLVSAVLITLIGGTWLAWSANHFSRPEVRANLISFKAIDAKSIEVRYSITFKTLARAHQCRLIAHDYDAIVVGEVMDQFPAGAPSQTRIVQIPTRLLAVNAGIDGCGAL
ncbi:MAG: DUF4307 domain-containing protein [Actinomycetes bacterium]